MVDAVHVDARVDEFGLRVHIYIYIYIEREREREGGRGARCRVYGCAVDPRAQTHFSAL